MKTLLHDFKHLVVEPKSAVTMPTTPKVIQSCLLSYLSSDKHIELVHFDYDLAFRMCSTYIF